jgi:AraC-like DNA-binding protein
MHSWQPAIPAALAAIIDGTWALRHDGDQPHRVPIAPDGCVDLIWRADPRGAELYCFGPGIKLTLATITPGSALVGVRLRQGHAHALLGVDHDALPAGPCPIAHAAALPTTARIPRAATQAAAEDAAHQLLDLLATRAQQADPPPARALDALAMIDASAGALRIDALADTLDICTRTLHRALRTATGLSPKALARIARLRHTIAAIQAEHTAPLAQLALQLGYTDQAHMSRELRALTGQTPRQLRADVRSLQD